MADRERLVLVTLYNHSAELQGRQGLNFLVFNPCDTFRVFRFEVGAICAGCGPRWQFGRCGLLPDSS